MRFLDYITACNNYDPADYEPLVIDGRRMGHMRPEAAEAVLAFDALFRRTAAGIELTTEREDIEQRSRPLAAVLGKLVETGLLSHLHGELYQATPGGRDQGRVLIDRAAAAFFGIRAFGQHINGYVGAGRELRLWVGKRSSDRRNFPGKLDHLVAGGLPYGIGFEENLIKECREEAGIAAALARTAVPVGTVTYVAASSRGLKPDTLYCYDLPLPEDFEPRCTDGEVEGFQLWPIDQVMETIRDGEAFKLNCNLVIIDFLIRHGYIGPGDEDYQDLVTGLHPALP